MGADSPAPWGSIGHSLKGSTMANGSQYALDRLAKMESDNARLRRAIRDVRVENARLNRQSEQQAHAITCLNDQVITYREQLQLPEADRVGFVFNGESDKPYVGLARKRVIENGQSQS